MSYRIPRCQIVPRPDHQASFIVDGGERLCWHFGPQYPRPYFYPLVGPGGTILTRMGHPGAPDHDHHRSIWFAHEKVLGINFWSDRTPARIRQKQWLAYQDGEDEAIMAVLLGWYDGHDPKELLTQELVTSVRLTPEGGTLVELQSTFTPMADSLELGRTNFGFLAVRVAKGISAHFGDGRITSSEGGKSEKEIFGKPARWVDYSGDVSAARQNNVSTQIATIEAGINYFDHLANPGHPPRWHVREDGWMGASVCRSGPLVIERSKPLMLRYLIHAHAGALDSVEANRIAEDFARAPRYVVQRQTGGHTQHIVQREKR
jgi:Family of unknown function (DUF6807)